MSNWFQTFLLVSVFICTPGSGFAFLPLYFFYIFLFLLHNVAKRRRPPMWVFPGNDKNKRGEWRKNRQRCIEHV